MEIANLWVKQIQKEQINQLAHDQALEISQLFQDHPDRSSVSYLHSLSERVIVSKSIRELIDKEIKRDSVMKYWLCKDKNMDTFYYHLIEILTRLNKDLDRNVYHYSILDSEEKREIQKMMFSYLCKYIANFFQLAELRRKEKNNE